MQEFTEQVDTMPKKFNLHMPKKKTYLFQKLAGSDGPFKNGLNQTQTSPTLSERYHIDD
jgi:hypothetical protein